jgi:steroid 5-alpha reductase family enzyme
MRRHWGDRFWIVSLGTVFLLQGVIMWTVSLPVQMGQVTDSPDSLGLVELLGVVIFGVGLFFEAVGDRQLARFKADPSNRGQVMDTGLWRYTRHPNYFGDCCVWWGLYVVAAATGVGALSIIGPIVMTVFLLRVSGVALLERSITKRRPGYEDYIARTNAFFPGPPKS